MSRARELSRLGDTNALGIQTGNLRVGSLAAGTKLEVATNVQAGIITATQYFGDGSGLTGLIAVSGVGITILDDGVSRGAVSKLNFGNYFSISTPNAGLATVTVGVDTGIILAQSAVVQGITTTQDLNVTGFATFSDGINAQSGIVTAGTFVGNLTGIATGATEAVNAFGLLGTPNVTIGFNTATKLTTTDLTSTDANITGIITAGIATCTEVFATNSLISGITTSAEIDASKSIEIIGFTTITNGGISALGVITATSFVGNLSGIVTGATEAANAFGLLGAPSITVTGINAAGIVTAQELIADDSGKLEVLGFTTITNGGVSVIGVGTFSSVDADSAIITGIVTANAHVDTGITTYYGDSSYAAAGRWTLAASGTDHYVFSGPGLGHSSLNDPSLYLMRGQTYMFENKMGAHPFRIQSDPNGSTGTQWNVGVTNNDVSNGVLIFEVPFECPSTLYYQCTAHANMGGVLYIMT